MVKPVLGLSHCSFHIRGRLAFGIHRIPHVLAALQKQAEKSPVLTSYFMAVITTLESLKHPGFITNSSLPLTKKKKKKNRESPVRSKVHLWHRVPFRNHTLQAPRGDREAVPQKEEVPVAKEEDQAA